MKDKGKGKEKTGANSVNRAKLRIQMENLKEINKELRRREISLRSQIEDARKQPVRALSPQEISKLIEHVRELMKILEINNLGETLMLCREREKECVEKNMQQNELSINKINRMLKR